MIKLLEKTNAYSFNFAINSNPCVRHNLILARADTGRGGLGG